MRYLLRHCSTDRPAYLVAECTLAALAAAHAVVGLPVPARTFPIALHTLDRQHVRAPKEAIRCAHFIHSVRSCAARRPRRAAVPELRKFSIAVLPAGRAHCAATREPKAATAVCLRRSTAGGGGHRVEVFCAAYDGAIHCVTAPRGRSVTAVTVCATAAEGGTGTKADGVSPQWRTHSQACGTERCGIERCAGTSERVRRVGRAHPTTSPRRRAT
jgi:hypothetical protein